MHPAIRILCFLILIVFLARADLIVLPAYFFVFVLLAAKHLFVVVKLASPLVLRLRWFWLSIMLLYAFMVPGEPVLAFGTSLIISKAGLLEGIERCASLLLVLLFFSLLNFYTNKAAWSDGIYCLLKPLKLFGIQTEKFSMRLSMTLQTVSTLQEELKSVKDSAVGLSSWRQIPEYISTMFVHVLSKSEQQEAKEYVFDIEGIKIFQWLYPASLLGVLWLFNYLRLVF